MGALTMYTEIDIYVWRVIYFLYLVFGNRITKPRMYLGYSYARTPLVEAWGRLKAND